MAERYNLQRAAGSNSIKGNGFEPKIRRTFPEYTRITGKRYLLSNTVTSMLELHRSRSVTGRKREGKNPKETPYTAEGREINFRRTKKKRIQARLDDVYSENASIAVLKGKWGYLNNFEFVMNKAYALNRDRLKCRVCGKWLIDHAPYTHRINPYLPLDKVNRVNNLISVHKKCSMAINTPGMDISDYEKQVQKKILSYREKLVVSHTRNN